MGQVTRNGITVEVDVFAAINALSVRRDEARAAVKTLSNDQLCDYLDLAYIALDNGTTDFVLAAAVIEAGRRLLSDT